VEPEWRSIDWSPHVHQMEIAGRKVNYADVGEGEAQSVVFVHGLGGNWQNWLENVLPTAENRRVLALDLPGFGDSEMPAEDISITGYAKLVDEFCDRLDLGAVAVVGNSMGGFIAAEMAIVMPARTDRIALVAAAGISSTHLSRRPLETAARYVAAVSDHAAARSRQIAVRSRLRHAVLSPILRHPTRLRADFSYEILRGAGHPGYAAALSALMRYDYRDRLPEIGCPALVIWGEKDGLVPLKDADEYERIIPDARKVILDDTGHMPMAERPATFQRCLMQFLDEEGEARDNLGGAGDAAAEIAAT